MNSPLPSQFSPPGELESSCRAPLLVLFISGAIWLLISSFLGLIASLKFHNPNFLADSAWLTYGRVRPACNNSLLYGFCIQAGLGVGLWLLARLGRTPMIQPGMVLIGAKIWNLGVTVGVAGILAGDGTGFENLDMPRYAAIILFLGYLVIGIWSLITFHHRRERRLFVSHWFLLAAMFWFPWIYATANLLLLVFPVRGVAQAVIAWWYSNNLTVVWLGAIGLAAIFYFIPKLTGRELQSRYLALLSFWILLLVASWSGIPNSAPVPAWMPALSTVASVLTLFCLLTVGMNLYRAASVSDDSRPVLFKLPWLVFFRFAVYAFIVAGIMNAAGALIQASPYTNLTWFTTAHSQLQVYGFFVMTLFGAIYYILPQLCGLELPSPKLMRWHLRFAVLGIGLVVGAFAIGGLIQGFQLQNPNVPFIKIAKVNLHSLRASTLGELLLLVGHVLFIWNLGTLAYRYYRTRAVSAYLDAVAVAPAQTAEVNA